MGIIAFIDAFRILWPPTAIKIIRRGGQAVAEFRKEQGREPTPQEWSEIANRVGREILH